MTNLVKWAWLILLLILFMGEWVFAVFVFYIVAYVLLSMFKPKWLEKLFQ